MIPCILGNPQVVQKRSSGRSMAHLLEADFWRVSRLMRVHWRTKPHNIMRKLS
jgi:hypothetical protein